MTPRMRDGYAARVEDELTRLVEQEQPAGQSAAAPPPSRPRPTVRIAPVIGFAVALALVIPAALFAVTAGPAGAPPAGGGTLTVATAALPTYNPAGDYAGVVGQLHARQSGASVCFWVTTLKPAEPFGSGPYYLVFPRGYAATATLDLLDEGGSVVASDGDPVAVYTAPHARPTSTEGCPAGITLSALHIARSAAEIESATPTPTSTPPAALGKGCAATATTMPKTAFSAKIDDIDGDGRADTEWALLDDFGMKFGVTTASGATISGQQNFAGGGERSFVIGRIGNGTVVAITSEGRDSPIYTFSGCAFHQVLLATATGVMKVGTPFSFYAEGSGSGGCFDGRLAMLHTIRTPGDTTGSKEDAIAQWVDLSADGRHATVTQQTATVATRLDDRTAESDRYAGVSCGAAAVLHPHG